MSNGHQKPEPRSININLRKLFDQSNYADDSHLAALVSPEGDDSNHPVAVRVNRGGEITEVTKSGTRLTAGPKPGRGVRIEIDFTPEHADDPWTLAFYFHKGQTYIQVLQRRGDCGDPTDSSFNRTIWRD